MIQYFFQTVIISALLALTYTLFFRSAKQFQLRRGLIIMIPVLSLIIPFADKLSFLTETIEGNFVITQMLDVVNVNATGAVTNSFPISLLKILMVVYGIVSIFLLVKLVFQIVGIIQLRNRSESKDGVYFVQNSHHPFSFFNSIFIPESQKEDVDIILDHERVHIEQKHSLDVIFYELLKVIFWFNPFYYILKKELSDVHEFLVDQKLLEKDIDIKKYCEILLQNGSLKHMAIGNNFNNSLTKIRFIMMTKNNNKKWIPFKVFGMLVVMLSMTLVFHNCNQEELTPIPQAEEKVEATPTSEAPEASADENKAVEFKDVDVQPEFPGGQQELMQFLGRNTTYPEVAKENGTQGRVFTSFKVGKDGKITDVEVLRVDTEADQESAEVAALKTEAIRVISAMPDWTPGEMDGKKVKVSYVVPLNFKLN